MLLNTEDKNIVINMKRRIMILGFLLVTIITVYGQKGVISLADEDVNPGAVISEIPVPEPKYEGSSYLSDEFEKGTIYFTTGHIFKNASYRFDILNELVEIQTDDVSQRGYDIAFVDSIQSIGFNREKLVNIKHFDKSKIGLLKVLKQRDNKVLGELTNVKVRKANYNVALNTGSKNHEFIKEEQYIYIANNKIIKEGLDRSTKSLAKAFSVNKKVVKSLITSNSLNLENDDQFFETLSLLHQKQEDN